MTILLFTSLLFSATSEQVDQYMSLSSSDRELIELEKMFDNLVQSLEIDDDNLSSQITLAYQIYLGKHISEDEMEELLTVYRKPVMQHFIVEMDSTEIPEEEVNNFLRTIEENPLPTQRMDIIDNLRDNLVDDETMRNFYKIMMQRYVSVQKETNQTNKEHNTTAATKAEKEFIEIIKEGTKRELLYGTQVLSIQEMQELNDIYGTPLMKKVTKIENEAIIDIMNNFIQAIISNPKILKSLPND